MRTGYQAARAAGRIWQKIGASVTLQSVGFWFFLSLVVGEAIMSVFSSFLLDGFSYVKVYVYGQ